MATLVEAIGHARHCPTVCLTADKATAWFAENNAAADELAKLRAGIASPLRIAEYRDSMSVSTDFEGRPYRNPIPQEDLRALLGDA